MQDENGKTVVIMISTDGENWLPCVCYTQLSEHIMDMVQKINNPYRLYDVFDQKCLAAEYMIRSLTDQ